MEKLFLSTRFTDDIYQLIIKACTDDLKKSEKKIKNIKIKVIKIRNTPDFKFLLKCIFYLLQGNFFLRKKIILLKYKGINFGKHLYTYTLRDHNAYKSSHKFYFLLLKNVLVISKYFKTADYYLKHYKFDNVYIDHLMYLNGIFYQIFKIQNKNIYTNCYPRNIIKTKNKNIKDILELDFKDQNFSNKKKKKIKDKAKKIFKNSNKFQPWMDYTKFNILKKNNFKKYDYIIYTHSFTDAQLSFEFDGFFNTLEWLEFTTIELQKRKVNFIIKAHPNWYSTSKKSGFQELSAWDKEIYSHFINRIKNDKKILIIKESISNKDLIKSLDKKCVAITKHGNAQFEMIHNNFKVISSKSNTLDHKYNLFNTWGNKKDYKKLLNQKWDNLKYCNKKNYLNVVNRLYLDDGAYFGKNNYMNILKQHMIKEKFIKKEATNIEAIIKFNSLKNKSKILDKINVPIVKL